MKLNFIHAKDIDPERYKALEEQTSGFKLYARYEWLNQVCGEGWAAFIGERKSKYCAALPFRVQKVGLNYLGRLPFLSPFVPPLIIDPSCLADFFFAISQWIRAEYWFFEGSHPELATQLEVWPEKRTRLTFDTQKSPEEHWNRYHKKARNQIRKAEKSLEFGQAKSASDVDLFVDYYGGNMLQGGVWTKAQAQKYRQLLQHYFQQGRLFGLFAIASGQPVAGSVLLKEGDYALGLGAFSNEQGRKYRAHALMLHERIRWCHEQGVAELDIQSGNMDQFRTFARPFAPNEKHYSYFGWWLPSISGQVFKNMMSLWKWSKNLSI